MKSTLLISPAEIEQFYQQQNVVIIDAQSGPDVVRKYADGHLRNAIHLDLDKDLSSKTRDPSKGGRHPLPAADKFAELLGVCGIDLNTQVLVYDDKSSANAAARFWWMLKSLGHEKIYVLDGGLASVVAEGAVLEKGINSNPAKPPYPMKSWKGAMADIEEVARVAGHPEHLVIDVRDKQRYLGNTEPIDPVAGHIPGAINIPFSTNLDAAGKFLTVDELQEKYKTAFAGRKPSNVVIHCGSGVTACHSLLALEHAGMYGAKLYVGSWSEWSRSGRTAATRE